MATTTPNLGLTKPTVGADADAWGGQLNASLDTLDAKVLDKTTGGTINGPISVTNLSYSGSLTGGTGVINIGSGQVYKDAAGNVGIGTSAPSIFGKISLAGNLFASDNAQFGWLSTFASAPTTYIDGSQANQHIRFFTNNAERLRLDSAGNLGLGVTPSAWDAGEKAFQLPTFGSIAFSGQDGRVLANAYINGAVFKYIATGSATQYLQSAGQHRFFTAPSGTAGAPINFTQAMTLTSGGNLLVGTTAFGVGRLAVQANSATEAIPYASNDTRADAASSQSFAFFRQGAQVGNISTTTTATSFNSASDYRLKNNQQPLTGSGAFIDALAPKTWEWSADGSRGVGFIAHEVQAVSPGSVTGEKDAVDAEGNPVYQAMEYGSAEFIANIVAELQSLRKRLAALEAK